MQLVVDRIVSFIQRKLQNANKQNLVLGMSGGVDSSVVAALAVKAVGPDHIIGVTMPCFSNKDDRSWAFFLAGQLGIKTMINLPLDNILDCFTKGLSTALSGTLAFDRMIQANNKARLRMTALYSIANAKTALVIGTGNKSEHMLGYFTKYGDGGTDFEPIGDLFKTEVWGLAKFLGIPKEIIDSPPSAGLWEGQTDQDELGYSYKEIDRVLKNSFSSLDGEHCTKDERKIVHDLKKRIRENVHKTLVPPYCYIQRDEEGDLVL